MKHSIALLCGAALVAALAGCGERAQTAQPAKKSDAKAWEGASTVSMAGSWKPGDQKAWEEQLRTRAQGQNEYVRSAP